MAKRIDLDTSRRIDIVRIILMSFVILAHTGRGFVSYVPNMEPTAAYIYEIFNNNVCYITVPLFFSISGYLFMRSFTLTPSAYFTMCKKKFITVFIPFLLFNLIWLLWIYFIGSIPNMGTKNFILQQGIFVKLFGINTLPINYPLWFLRDLLIIFAVSPVFILIFNEIRYLGLLLLYYLWMTQNPTLAFTLYGHAFFFYLGGIFSRQELPIGESTKIEKLIIPLYLAVLFFLTIDQHFGLDQLTTMYIFKANMVLGVFFLWCISRFDVIKNNKLLEFTARYAFFIYLAHEPTLSFLQKFISTFFTPTNSATQLLYYFGSCIATMAIALCIGMALEKTVPSVYAFATGARMPRKDCHAKDVKKENPA
ncbi:acyltransferase family protein [Desulfovibrio inopinatus]|uniref:acyltransferase family protein n=1 Tax=Desulfovibrio inopinatus TaxID=102109 RepID=UPI0004094E8E|nr:acyltransferase [Desulfovibrio inopinatus]